MHNESTSPLLSQNYSHILILNKITQVLRFQVKKSPIPIMELDK